MIFFDNYDLAIELIQSFNEQLPSAKFVIAVRTGVQEVRLHEILTKLPQPVRRIDLNEATDEDKVEFFELLNSSGALKPNLSNRIRSCVDIREIVTSIYNNTEIRDRMKNALAPLFVNTNIKSVLITGLLLSWINHEGSPAFFRSVTDVDPYVELSKHREISSDIFKLSDEDLQVRSSILAEYLLIEHCSPDDVISVLHRSIIAAVRRKRERKYRAILGSLMQYSRLRRLLRNDNDAMDRIKRLYEELQHDVGVRDEPLFWLQYTILMIDSGRLGPAEGFLEKAYERARASPDFETYQIDTQALRLFLLAEQADSSAHRVSRFDRIIETSQLVLGMVSDQSHRSYAIRVLEGFESFVTAAGARLLPDERDVISTLIERMVDALSHLSPEVRSATGSDPVKLSLERARQHLATVGTRS